MEYIWKFLKKLKIEQPCDPAVSFLDKHLEKTIIQKDTSTRVHCNTIYNSQDMEAGMDKAYVVHIYNGILLNHKKEQNNAICSNMDGPRDCHTE